MLHSVRYVCLCVCVEANRSSVTWSCLPGMAIFSALFSPNLHAWVKHTFFFNLWMFYKYNKEIQERAISLRYNIMMKRMHCDTVIRMKRKYLIVLYTIVWFFFVLCFASLLQLQVECNNNITTQHLMHMSLSTSLSSFHTNADKSKDSTKPFIIHTKNNRRLYKCKLWGQGWAPFCLPDSDLFCASTWTHNINVLSDTFLISDGCLSAKHWFVVVQG